VSTWTYPVVRGLDGRPLLVGVRDGDTVRLVLDAGAEVGLFPWLRVAGVNAAERGTPGAAEATSWVTERLLSSRQITVTILYRSFERWVARIVVDGRDLAEEMIEAGHGVTVTREVASNDPGPSGSWLVE
jgi:endonuclease YncB( thermonuclease family)